MYLIKNKTHSIILLLESTVAINNMTLEDNIVI